MAEVPWCPIHKGPHMHSPADQRDAHARALSVIDGLSGADAKLILAHLADEDVTAFWRAFDARGLTVTAADTS